MSTKSLRASWLFCLAGCASSGPTGPAVGTLTGTINTTAGSPIGAGVTVTATVDATKMAYVDTTAADGTFKITRLPVGSGEITLSTLPNGCGTPPAVAYTTTNNGGTKVVNLIVACGP